MSIPSLPSDHCDNIKEFLSKLDGFKEASPNEATKKVFNRFLVENEEYVKSVPKLIEKLCKRFSLVPPRFKSEASLVDLPEEVQSLILRQLGRCDLANVAEVNKSLNTLANDEVLGAQFVFGKKQWAEYLNADVGIEPPLPLEIGKILLSPCPIFGPNKTIGETHMLVLVPKAINDLPLNLNNFESLLWKRNAQAYIADLWDVFPVKPGDNPIKESYWVLINTFPQIYPQDECGLQDKILKISEKAHATYELPKVLEAIICIFIRNLGLGESDSFRERIICHESDGGGRPMFIKSLGTNLFEIGSGYHSGGFSDHLYAIRKLS